LPITSSGVRSSSAKVSVAGMVCSRHSGQIFRTSRWASTASSVAVIKKGGTPMSRSRVTVLGASLVCSVLKTMCPVSEACTAISAVSKSRISPTRILSGSWRRIDRRQWAKVLPMPLSMGICTMPSSSYSTGSSVVISLSSTTLSSFSAP
jgi:hypothetical protein